VQLIGTIKWWALVSENSFEIVINSKTKYTVFVIIYDIHQKIATVVGRKAKIQHAFVHRPKKCYILRKIPRRLTGILAQGGKEKAAAIVGPR
jgi:hypothetical protein